MPGIRHEADRGRWGSRSANQLCSRKLRRSAYSFVWRESARRAFPARRERCPAFGTKPIVGDGEVEAPTSCVPEATTLFMFACLAGKRAAGVFPPSKTDKVRSSKSERARAWLFRRRLRFLFGERERRHQYRLISIVSISAADVPIWSPLSRRLVIFEAFVPTVAPEVRDGGPNLSPPLWACETTEHGPSRDPRRRHFRHG